MAASERMPLRERRPSVGAPIVDIQGSVGPEGISRPKHRRTFTGFGAGEIKHVEASIPEPQREAWLKHQTGGFKDKDGFEREVVRHVETTLARSLYNCDESAAYAACALAFRDRLILEWNRTQQRQTFADSKRVYYLSLEFLMGRALDNAMLNVGQKDLAKEEEKRAANARVLGNQTGSNRDKRSDFKWEQVWSTFRNPQTYFFFVVAILSTLPNGANTTFSKLISQSFGFTPLETVLKGSTLYYSVSICWFLIVGIITLKRPNLRFLLMMSSLVPAFTGMMALSQLPTDRMRWVRWAMYIMQCFGTLSGLMIWTFLPSNVAGRTKKTVTATVLFIAYCVGNAIGAQMFVPSDAPKFIKGITACAVLYILEFCAMGAWRFYYIWENRRRAKIIAEQGLDADETERLGKINAEADMTDRENIYFKYKY